MLVGLLDRPSATHRIIQIFGFIPTTLAKYVHTTLFCRVFVDTFGSGIQCDYPIFYAAVLVILLFGVIGFIFGLLAASVFKK